MDGNIQAAHRPSHTSAVWPCALGAIALHAAVLILWRMPPNNPPVLEIEGDRMEVALVEAAPPANETALEPPPPTPPPPVEPPPPEPPKPPKPPKPEPAPPEKPPEMTIPEPPKSQTPPMAKTTPAPRPTKPPARPPTVSGAGAPNRSTTTTSTPGIPNAKPAGKPAFVARPTAAYPPESRAASEQGVVILRITVNAEGRPTAVQVARSSGFPRLDRAAVEGGWRARVSNAVAGAQFEAPVRFSLHN